MSSTKSVRTRFAPSPTGMLHIGGARTALFNYVLAKHMGGEFLVRIEDTDKERSTRENCDAIAEGLSWLGLTPDAPYVMQSMNEARHVEVARQMLDAGKAYMDDGAVRIRIPEGKTVWKDLVQGEITYDNAQLEDFVLLRSDSTPTYMLAVVVDDHDMGITHVIRGDDHINNTPKQILLYQAMGWDVPNFGHIPLIHGSDGKKLSKRHGATGVMEYQSMGYLPEALNNYLMRLGWSLGDEEKIAYERIVEKFDITKVNKGASIFDFKKLDWLNAQYIKEADNSRLIQLMEEFWSNAGLAASEQALAWVEAGLDEIKPRAKRLDELADACSFYLKSAPFTLDEKLATTLAQGKAHLSALTAEFEACETWNNDNLFAIIDTYVKTGEYKFKEIGMPLRLALMGTTSGPGVSAVMEVLGRAESLNRLNAAK